MTGACGAGSLYLMQSSLSFHMAVSMNWGSALWSLQLEPCHLAVYNYWGPRLFGNSQVDLGRCSIYIASSAATQGISWQNVAFTEPSNISPSRKPDAASWAYLGLALRGGEDGLWTYPWNPLGTLAYDKGPLMRNPHPKKHKTCSRKVLAS